jgi:hypothetical protein
MQIGSVRAHAPSGASSLFARKATGRKAGLPAFDAGNAGLGPLMTANASGAPAAPAAPASAVLSVLARLNVTRS